MQHLASPAGNALACSVWPNLVVKGFSIAQHFLRVFLSLNRPYQPFAASHVLAACCMSALSQIVGSAQQKSFLDCAGCSKRAVDPTDNALDLLQLAQQQQQVDAFFVWSASDNKKTVAFT